MSKDFNWNAWDIDCGDKRYHVSKRSLAEMLDVIELVLDDPNEFALDSLQTLLDRARRPQPAPSGEHTTQRGHKENRSNG